jgi:hypothetical protein
MQIVVFPHLPPSDLRPLALKLQPGRDIGFVVEIGDDNLITNSERTADRQV